jgi:hypothetical protein
MALNRFIGYLIMISTTLSLGFDSSLTSSNLTLNDRSTLEKLLQNGCQMINQPNKNDDDDANIEKKKLNKALRFAVIYSGQVCHGRGALGLYDKDQMQIYWKNKNKYLHKPLQQWGSVDIFGLFEEMAIGSIAIGGKAAGTQERADGCNDFVHLVNWTRIEFMPSEAHLKKGKIVAHGEERRIEALNRFIGIENWHKYDLVLQFRPDVMLRIPITQWGIHFNKVNYAHFEGSPRECDPRFLINKIGDYRLPPGVPAIGDRKFTI